MLQAGDRKTKVTPKVKITIPRMEQVAAVNSVRLAKKVREALRIPSKVLHGLISSPGHAQDGIRQVQ
jgi:hypothetical protein